MFIVSNEVIYVGQLAHSENNIEQSFLEVSSQHPAGVV